VAGGITGISRDSDLEDENMNKKAALDIPALFISIALFSLIITVFVGSVSHLATKYTDMGFSVTVDESMSKIFDKTEALNNQTEELTGLVGKTPTNLWTATTSFLYGAWSALIKSFGSISIATEVISIVADTLGVPPIVGSFIIFGLTISFIFAIIYIVFRVGGYV
jgi:hypothetical protein